MVFLLTAIFVAFGNLFLICGTTTNLQNYFEKSEKNLYHLNILPEYELERYVFPAVVPKLSDEALTKAPDGTETTLYRMPAGPKSPRGPDKRPAYIQHAILCDSNPCTINRPQIAIAYILVDRGYDVWLGISNSSIAENLLSDEETERERLAHVATFILNATNADELSVMAYFNGSVQFFGIAAPSIEKEKSRLATWLEYIPGVKLAKNWYAKGKNFFKRGYDKVVRSFDTLGQKIDFITDDFVVRDLKNTVLGAWGYVKSMVIPTFTVYDFSEMISHPDVNLDTLQLLSKYGYNAVSHNVVTEDGYLLTLHRIVGSKKNPKLRNNAPVVFLQHGLLASSADWVLMGPNKSLGYILSDEGYDVWMGNARGNTYSKAHVSLSISDMKFWDFSWHEIGLFDLSASIDYVISTTGQDKIFYVGHSQGTTCLFVLLSERPEYNDKIIKAVLYSPIAYTEHMRSPIIKVFSQIQTPLYYVLRFLHVYEFLPTNALLTKLGRDACEAQSVYQVVCSNVLFLITGYNTEQLNKTMVPVIFGHIPAGSSIKQLFHYAQEYKSKKFQQFDYSIPFMNQKKYGQSEPPEYKISNIKIPVAIFYADNDLLSDYRDIARLVSEIPNVELFYKVPHDHFNHIDFLYGIVAPEIIYHPTVQYLQNSTV